MARNNRSSFYATPRTGRNSNAMSISRSTRSRAISALGSMVSNRVGGAIGRRLPYVGTAMRAVEAGRSAYRAINRVRAMRRARGLSNKTSGIYNGKYQGKFKKTNKKTAKKLSVYLNNGFVDTQEISGTVSDPDCCYLQHSAIDADYQLKMVRRVLLRKLLKKSIGWDCANADENIPVEQTTGVANSLVIELSVIDESTGSITYWSVTTSALINTINLIADNADFEIAFRKYASGTYLNDQMNTEKLLYFRCYMLDFAPLGTNHRLLGQIEIGCQTVHVNIKSEMKIQNRSLGAGGSSDSTAVNNNPVVGYQYDFKTGTPQSRQNGAYLLETTGGFSAVSLVRSAQLPNGFKEPPLPAVFLGVEKASRIRIQPGDIKKGVLYYKTKMNLLKYITSVGYRYNTFAVGPNFKAKHVLGKCQLYALEDVINVNVNENITLAYEVNREIAVYMTEKKVVPSIGKFTQIVLNNNPG